MFDFNLDMDTIGYFLHMEEQEKREERQAAQEAGRAENQEREANRR